MILRAYEQEILQDLKQGHVTVLIGTRRYGKLREKSCISERIKQQQFSEQYYEFYFRRTYDRQETDLVEDNGMALPAFEFKTGIKPARVPKAFATQYPRGNLPDNTPSTIYDFLVSGSGDK